MVNLTLCKADTTTVSVFELLASLLTDPSANVRINAAMSLSLLLQIDALNEEITQKIVESIELPTSSL